MNLAVDPCVGVHDIIHKTECKTVQFKGIPVYFWPGSVGIISIEHPGYSSGTYYIFCPDVVLNLTKVRIIDAAESDVRIIVIPCK